MTGRTFKQLIDGTWVEASSGGKWTVQNPANEEAIVEVPYGGAEDCKSAIAAAERSFHSWSRETAYSRAAVLKKAAEIIRQEADSFAEIMSFEAGKPIAEAKGEWGVAADLLEWFAEEGKRSYGRTIPSRRADKRMTVIFQPLGVVGVITAWNFPAYNPARACAAALAAGCTVVLRPSEFTPLSAMLLASALERAGVPAGVFNLVNGDPGPMGQAMLEDPALRKISFTGSPRVGKLLLDGASRTMTRLGLELGGNAPVLILPDIDVESVAKSAVTGKFRNCGQVCVSPQRFMVHSSIHQQFAEVAAATARSLKIGAGNEPGVNIGPMINKRQREFVSALVDDAAKAGANVAAGGKIPADRPKGYFYEPTILSAVPDQARIFNEEAFGPVLPMFTFTDLDEAIAKVNRCGYGLAGYVWTNNLTAATYAAERLECGIVGINDWAPHATEAPFGGWKQSGLGFECGSEGLLDYMERKLISTGAIPTIWPK
jgi:succinate-semialdehyde dehydrogenase/glutarate-semialdehyde dehydrogenase